ncbi:MAG TPA: hypothetical protein VE776_03985 [Actinomycetota bacterium]|nr:hypothetical protein [Actinomycetota bacterium]
MTDTVRKRAALRAEDRERMQRLSEEVQGRIREMALITARTLGIDLAGDTVVKFAPVKADRASLGEGPGLGEEPGQTIEIVCGPEGCGCYVDPPGICEFPCGAAGPL